MKDDDYGVLTAPDTVRIERLLPGPIERAWAWITEEDKRAQWLAGGAMDLQVGGRVALTFRHKELTHADDPAPPKYADMAACAELLGQVTVCEPPHRLAHTWGGQGEVQYELREVEGGVRLVITHQRLPSRDDVLSVSAGWHAHLDLLVARMRGREAPRYWRLHSRLEVDYADRFPV